MGDPEREEIEDLWRSRLRDAQLRLDFARNFVKEVQQDYSLSNIPTADGHFALQKALREMNYALAEYQRVLRIFTALILEGKIPDDNPWLHRKVAGAA